VATPPVTDLPAGGPVSHTGALHRLGAAGVVGAVAGGITVALHAWELAPMAVWDGIALVWVAWTWRTLWPMDAESTAAHATSEDPGQSVTDTLLGIACLASLLAVGLVLVKAADATGAVKGELIGAGVVSVVLSWTTVHTVFALRYARLYYGGHDGGISFNQKEKPDYADFAYLAFTLGMTFQVSDTDLQTREIRRQALKHALLSYLFGTVIVATTINLIAGLTK
jgi:uncharacterized membrane protein